MRPHIRLAGNFILVTLLLAGCHHPDIPAIRSADTSHNHGLLASADDLKDKKLGVLMGSVHDTYANKTYPKAQVLQFDNTADLTLAVSTGKVDAGFSDADALREVLLTHNELAVLGKPLFSLPVGAGFNLKNTALRNEFNDFLAEIRENGTLADMSKRWVQTRDNRMPDIPITNPHGKLNVAVALGGLPFGAVENNEMVGFDVELARRFAAKIHKTVSYSQMPFASLIAATASGKADMIAASMFITEERAKRIAFSNPYYEAGVVVYALKSNIATSPTTSTFAPVPRAALVHIDDLKDKRLGVQLGTVYDDYATKTFPQATIIQYHNSSDLILAVTSGKIDAGFSDIDSLTEIMSKNSAIDRLGEPLFSSPVAAGFNKKTGTKLRADFNTFLSNLRQSGVYADMVKRWTINHATKMPEIPSSTSHGVLRVAISSGGLPFAGVQDGTLVGFDVELVKRFAASMGKEVQFYDMEFGGLVAAVAVSKVDMCASDMFITEERKKRIDFSDPYFAQDSVAFALKTKLVPTPAVVTQPKQPSFFRSVATSFQNNIIQEKRYLLLWDGLKATVIISIFATMFGTVLGGLICFMRMSRLVLVNAPAKIYISILRGMPVVVLLMLIFYVAFASVDISPLVVAVIAFGMNFAAYVAEIFRTGIEGVDRGQSEAATAMGFTKTQAFKVIVLPQMIKRILPVYKGEFISLVKMTSIVGYIAVQDLTKASDIIRSRTFDAFFPLIMVAVLYFIISWVLMQVLEYLERVTDPKYQRRKAGAR